MRILLVEDDLSLAAGLQHALGQEGFVVDLVNSGNQALTAVKNEAPDIVVLDLGLPDMDGLEVLNKIRQRSKSIPVMVLTARDKLDDKVIGLDHGADDYMAKPFDMKELAARLRVFERRLSTASTSIIQLKQVSLDTSAHTVTVNGKLIDCSRREYMLLKALMESTGRVLTRESLETRLYSWGEEVISNALEVHIHNLRKKLPEKFIKTVRGIGYTVA